MFKAQYITGFCFNEYGLTVIFKDELIEVPIPKFTIGFCANEHRLQVIFKDEFIYCVSK